MTRTSVLPTPAARVPALRMFAALLRAELTRLLRNRAFLVPSLLLPVMFFALFALPNIQGHLGGIGAGPYMLVSYAAYSLVSTALFTFGGLWQGWPDPQATPALHMPRGKLRQHNPL